MNAIQSQFSIGAIHIIRILLHTISWRKRWHQLIAIAANQSQNYFASANNGNTMIAMKMCVPSVFVLLSFCCIQWFCFTFILVSMDFAHLWHWHVVLILWTWNVCPRSLTLQRLHGHMYTHFRIFHMLIVMIASHDRKSAAVLLALNLETVPLGVVCA